MVAEPPGQPQPVLAGPGALTLVTSDPLATAPRYQAVISAICVPSSLARPAARAAGGGLVRAPNRPVLATAVAKDCWDAVLTSAAACRIRGLGSQCAADLPAFALQQRHPARSRWSS